MSGQLVARTVPVDDEVDLTGWAGDDGFLFAGPEHGLAGRGEVARLALASGSGRLAVAAEEVAEALAAIEVDDRLGVAGTGPVAFLALPFDDDASAEAVIPAVVFGRATDGARWMTSVTDQEAPPTEQRPPAESADGYQPTRYTITSPVAPEAWCAAVAAVRDQVRCGAAEKVVLAREVVVEADAPLRVGRILRRLERSYPSAFRFSVDGFVGASPELLVARRGELVRSQPMAGTVARAADPTTDARLAASLLASTKDQAEHRITIDAVLDRLLPFCSYVDAEAEPSVVAVANVAHLATLVRGRLSSPPASALALAAALHPTPAVGGSPQDEALALIARFEGFDRGRYAGPVGWVDAGGDGTFAVAVRCAEVQDRRARLFAGNGVVADSDPATELEETRAKLSALLSAIVQP